MQKEIRWILLIALGVFLGMFAYEKYSVYRTQLAIQEFVETVSEAVQAQSATVQANHSAVKRQQDLKIEQERRAEFDRTTACGVNEDKGTCSCLSTTTGAMISISHQECLERARAGTH